MNNNRQQQHSPNSESAESEVERTGEQQIRFERQQRNFMMDLLNKSAKVVQVTYPRTANNEKELSVSRGEYLEVIDDTRKWWRARNLEGQVGHVPHTIVTPSQGLTDSPQVSPKSAEWIQKERRGKKGEFRYFWKSFKCQPSPQETTTLAAEKGLQDFVVKLEMLNFVVTQGCEAICDFRVVTIENLYMYSPSPPPPSLVYRPIFTDVPTQFWVKI